jgi:hypothetical protein
MRKSLAVLALAFSLSPSLAFAHDHRSYPREPPPAVRVEVSEPRPGYVWVGGHHRYRRDHYVWTRGRYQHERRGRGWRDGAWERHDDHYDWRRGGWQRR